MMHLIYFGRDARSQIVLNITLGTRPDQRQANEGAAERLEPHLAGSKLKFSASTPDTKQIELWKFKPENSSKYTFKYIYIYIYAVLRVCVASVCLLRLGEGWST